MARPTLDESLRYSWAASSTFDFISAGSERARSISCASCSIGSPNHPAIEIAATSTRSLPSQTDDVGAGPRACPKKYLPLDKGRHGDLPLRVLGSVDYLPAASRAADWR